MVPLEGLSVTAIVTATSRVTDVTDRRPASVFAHEAFGFAAVVEPKGFIDSPQLAVGVDELIAMGVERGHPGRELPPILDVE
jgi:hypothetical protein